MIRDDGFVMAAEDLAEMVNEDTDLMNVLKNLNSCSSLYDVLVHVYTKGLDADYKDCRMLRVVVVAAEDLWSVFKEKVTEVLPRYDFFSIYSNYNFDINYESSDKVKSYNGFISVKEYLKL